LSARSRGLFYKYRAIEKIAEGRSVYDALLLVERCNGTSAFGNGWGYCNAVEAALGIDVPARANLLRTLLRNWSGCATTPV